MPTDNPDALRRILWYETDRKYKRAVEQLTKVKANVRVKVEEEDQAGDFSPGEPEKWKELSALFQEATHVFASQVQAHLRRTATYFLNSEGSSYVQSAPSARIQALAGTQASDGTELEDFVVAYGRSWEDLPGQPELAQEIRGMTAHLDRRREAEDIELYSGPVIFEGQAAAELVSQVLVPRLLAQRVPTLDDPRNELPRDRGPDFMMGGGGSMEAPLMSLVTPSLLFEDLTLKRPAEAIPRPPVTSPPARGQ